MAVINTHLCLIFTFYAVEMKAHSFVFLPIGSGERTRKSTANRESRAHTSDKTRDFKIKELSFEVASSVSFFEYFFMFPNW